MSRILDALTSHARENPGGVAVTGSHVALTWQQLATEITKVEAVLSGKRRVGLLMANSPAWVVADLACMKTATTLVPLPSFFSDEQLQHTLLDAGIDLVITDDPDRVVAVGKVKRSCLMYIADKACYCLQLHASPEQTGIEDVIKVTYTSGTTGSPRGVCLSLETVETVAVSLAEAAAASNTDRALVLLPLSILLENIGSVYVPLLVGAELLVPDPAETGLSGSSQVDAGHLASALTKYRPTALIVPPALLKLLVHLAGAQLLPDSLRFIATGGAPIGMSLLAAAASLDLPVYQGYGLSETGSVVALNTVVDNRPGSVGKPLPHVHIHISDAGEIMVQSDTLADYLKDPVRENGNLLATGDTGYIDAEGYLFVTGRMCERIITSYGRNISPEWIEAELLSHPAIRQAAVFGNDLPFLVAILVPMTSGALESMDKVIATINEKLPDYARIDGWLEANPVFSMARGELTPSGTLRRRVIEKNYSRQLDGYREHAQENIL